MSGPRRILVIDDEESVARLLRDFLTFRGYQVAVAGDGPEGLRQAGLGAFDLVTADLSMPGMTGVELLRSLKRARPEVRVVIISGYLTDEIAAECRAAGAAAVLAKPVELAALGRLVAGLLGGNSGPERA
jgi:CheY-like chemotaxis protein